jgi:hypothetical protein
VDAIDEDDDLIGEYLPPLRIGDTLPPPLPPPCCGGFGDEDIKDEIAVPGVSRCLCSRTPLPLPPTGDESGDLTIGGERDAVGDGIDFFLLPAIVVETDAAGGVDG